MTTEQFDCYRYTLIGMTEIAEQYVTELGQDEDFKFYIGNTHDEIFYSLSILPRRQQWLMGAKLLLALEAAVECVQVPFPSRFTTMTTLKK